MPKDYDPCIGYDSWLDTCKENRIHQHFGIVLEWAIEKTHRLPHLTIVVEPVGDDERRISIRAKNCYSGSQLKKERHNKTVCKNCWKAVDECLQKAVTATTRQYAVAIYQHAVVGEGEEAETCRAALDNMEFLDPEKNLRKEYDKIKDMRPLELGPYLKNKYDAVQDVYLTEYGKQIKKFFLDKVFSQLAVRSATELERSVIFKLQSLVGHGGLDKHDVELATSVTCGKISQDKVAMGLLEGSMLMLNTSGQGTSFRGRLRNLDTRTKDRLRCTALCVASRKCSSRLKDMLYTMKFPNVIQDKVMLIPSTYAAMEDVPRMRECAIAVRNLSPEKTWYLLTADATCLAAGVLPCSAKWSPTNTPCMLGCPWHWANDCSPIIKSIQSEDGEWSPEIPVTDISPASYMFVVTVRRADHSWHHVPMIEVPLIRESMPQEEYAKIIAQTVMACTESGLPISGIAFDGTGCADLVDGVLLSFGPSCKKAVSKNVPLFCAAEPCGYIFKCCHYRGAMVDGVYLSGWTSPLP